MNGGSRTPQSSDAPAGHRLTPRRRGPGALIKIRQSLHDQFCPEGVMLEVLRQETRRNESADECADVFDIDKMRDGMRATSAWLTVVLPIPKGPLTQTIKPSSPPPRTSDLWNDDLADERRERQRASDSSVS